MEQEDRLGRGSPMDPFTGLEKSWWPWSYCAKSGLQLFIPSIDLFGAFSDT